jgi:aminoglycoside phosphotransferase (APT) family kinase protein
MRAGAARFTGGVLLHGDVHPGNAMVRTAAGGRPQAVLLDWGRARTGSPLEDVMSWLHSLGFWEPSARRIHDTLLTRYLHARGLTDGLSSDLRAACWIAGACNAMAGALRYHLAVAADEERDPVERWKSSNAAADWLRIIRRADTVWRA